MIDAQLRAKGIGGSEIAALVGLDPKRDAFSVYAEKLGLVEKEEATPRMRAGRRFEKPICEWYADATGQTVIWSDITQSPVESRPWQIATVDAFVYENPQKSGEPIPAGLVDCKLVALDQAWQWGEDGTDEVPERYALQCHWYMSAHDLPWADIAAAMGPYNLRIYRIARDPEIETTILEVAERFWRENVLARVAPPIGNSDTAARYIKQRFSKNVDVIREATPDELEVLFRYKNERAVYNEAKNRKEVLENEVRLIIGNADGIKDPVLGKVTWKKTKNTVGPDWKAVAEHLHEELLEAANAATFREPVEPLTAYAHLHETVLREGSRRLLVPRTWKTDAEEEE